MYNIQNNHFKELKVSYPEIVLSIKSTASKLDEIYFFISGLELKKKKKREWQLKNWQGWRMAFWTYETELCLQKERRDRRKLSVKMQMRKEGTGGINGEDQDTD